MQIYRKIFQLKIKKYQKIIQKFSKLVILFEDESRPKEYNPQFSNSGLETQDECKALCANTAGCRSFLWNNQGNFYLNLL